MNSLVQHQKTDHDQDGCDQDGVLALHPVLEPRQRRIEAVARNGVGQDRQRDRRSGDRDVPGDGEPDPGDLRARSVPIAKPAAAQMNSTLGLTNGEREPRRARASGCELRQALHPLRGVLRLLSGEPSVDAEHDQRRTDDDAQPGRPARRLAPEAADEARHLEEDAASTPSGRPASRPGMPAPSAAGGACATPAPRG